MKNSVTLTPPFRPRWALTLAAGLCWLVSGSALAADDKPWLMAKYDLNGDNAITLQELTDKKKSLFSQLDHDRDGVISFDEYEGIDSAKRKVVLKSRFDRLDENQDGQVTEEEYASFVGRFNHLDSDGDGALSSGEMAQKKLASQETNSAHCLLWFCFRSNL